MVLAPELTAGAGEKVWFEFEAALSSAHNIRTYVHMYIQYICT
jgi:hypothetical protein